MRKYFLPLVAILFMAASANAQLDSTKVVDNKGTIKYVLKATNSNGQPCALCHSKTIG